MSALAWISPPAISETITSQVDRSLETCSSKLKEDTAGWQKLQLLLASRDDWVEMCAEQIRSDLRAAADRDYESGNAPDQSFRQRIDEISEYVSDQTATGISGNNYQNSSVERFVVVDVNEKSRPLGESAGEPIIETLPGYEAISK
jgi:hypothetical protein